MLELRDITKDYETGDTVVHALRGISVTFRDQEFVSILGQSGCGKSTLLNIVGGLDHYTGGDLIINGRSTKSYADRDWDTYRNHSVGFVFQSYNLIPHQSVAANVEMALLLSGVSRAERRERAERALVQVGLGEHMRKLPNQLSGGQMQRVAIARALVNDPEIILADEPTGALDTETSVEVMEILKELSRDRLVVMVTHNPQLAETYSDRIVRISDGVVVDDSDPCEGARLSEEEVAAHAKADAAKGKRRMSYRSAIQLSFTNLMTKKGRTFLTAFAGSIGIIGIALILSLSSGAQDYISSTEESTMGSYPLSIQRTAVDLSGMMSALAGAKTGDEGDVPEGATVSKNIVGDMVSSMAAGSTENDMAAIKDWLETNPGDIDSLVSDIQYRYDTPLNVYATDTSEGIVQVNPATVMQSMGISTSGDVQSQMMSSMSDMGSGYDVWNQMLDDKDAVDRDFDVVAGRLPKSWDEAVIQLDEDGRISDYTLYALNLMDQTDLSGMMSDAMAGKEVEESDQETFTYDELMDLSFSVLPQTALYSKTESGLWQDRSEDTEYMQQAIASAEKIHIVGVVRATEDSGTASAQGGVLYTSDLMNHLVDEVDQSEIVADQRAMPTTDVFTGLPFSDETSADMSIDEISALIAQMPAAQAAQASALVEGMRAQGMSDEEVAAAFSRQMSSATENATYDGNLDKLGVVDLESPSTINIYPIDFEAKESIDALIDEYNQDIEDSGEGTQIQYTDIVGTMMSSVTSIVNAITYILIAFVAISLVVSSIMIGIITYISVLERTKEIGILRAIGASKRDVSRIFTAETFITGLVSGVLGIAVTALLDIPINMVIEDVAGVADMASVPVGAGAVLVLISVALALIAGVAPSRMAARKDPVTALRTE